MVVGRRLAAFVAILSLSAGHAAVCAGWQPTPEARMACCTGDEAACPMHTAPTQSHGVAAQHAVDQAQANSCCAASERTKSATPGTGFPMMTSFAVVATPFAVALPTLTLHVDGRRAAIPLPPSRVPTHLLLSVFLV
jgi:hypothetical protein